MEDVVAPLNHIQKKFRGRFDHHVYLQSQLVDQRSDHGNLMDHLHARQRNNPVPLRGAPGVPGRIIPGRCQEDQTLHVGGRGMRIPAYPGLDSAVRRRGHVFCSLLALVLKKELDHQLVSQGLQFEWADIKQDLKALQEVTLEECRVGVVLRNGAIGARQSVEAPRWRTGNGTSRHQRLKQLENKCACNSSIATRQAHFFFQRRLSPPQPTKTLKARRLSAGFKRHSGFPQHHGNRCESHLSLQLSQHFRKLHLTFTNFADNNRPEHQDN